jgi:catechol 2,3-dioxygenase-like lactoylglutathione lyase family enzyme
MEFVPACPFVIFGKSKNVMVLGMRLVKKTVNQDDIYTYHTFFADDVGSAGTDMTFFEAL